MKVLFAVSECAPIYKTGGLGDVAGSLPKALAKLGVDIRVVMPKYPDTTSLNRLPGSTVPVYYIKNPAFFEVAKSFDIPVDIERRRFVFFSRAILESLAEWDFWPDVLHLNDWHTSLIPLLLKTVYRNDPWYQKIATLLTIHTLAYQGIAPPEILEEADLTPESLKSLKWDVYEWNPAGRQDIDILAQGIINCDIVNTVSPTYAKEILSPKFGAGLEHVLKGKEARLFGVLNGVDYDVFNPATDRYLKIHYDLKKQKPRDLKILNWREGKKKNKQALQERCRLKVDTEIPLIGMITRLAEPKGIDLLVKKDKDGQTGIDRLVDLGAQLVILGQGEKVYEEAIRKIASRHPDVSVNIRFDEELARFIYAGSDIFLMPSHFEPCGLVQIIAMRYGAIPVVRKTGGLSDTVKDQKTGFFFKDYSTSAMLSAVRKALGLLGSEMWAKMVEMAMSQDFSWEKSAEKYVKLYERAIKYHSEALGG